MKIEIIIIIIRQQNDIIYTLDNTVDINQRKLVLLKDGLVDMLIVKKKNNNHKRTEKEKKEFNVLFLL